jgi:hypothetical protein
VVGRVQRVGTAPGQDLPADGELDRIAARLGIGLSQHTERGGPGLRAVAELGVGHQPQRRGRAPGGAQGQRSDRDRLTRVEQGIGGRHRGPRDTAQRERTRGDRSGRYIVVGCSAGAGNGQRQHRAGDQARDQTGALPGREGFTHAPALSA